MWNSWDFMLIIIKVKNIYIFINGTHSKKCNIAHFKIIIILKLLETNEFIWKFIWYNLKRR